jgi:hypothetical protein
MGRISGNPQNVNEGTKMIIKGNKRSYKVISGWMVIGGITVPLLNINPVDIEGLTMATIKAENDPGSTWDLFGGTIDINTRTYQLA